MSLRTARGVVTAGPLRLASPRTALLLGATTLLLVVAAVPLAVLSQGQSTGLLMLPFGIVGFLVAVRQPRNPIGWILLSLAFVFLLSGDAGEYAVMAYRQGYHLPLARPAVFLAGFWIWLIVLLPLPVLLFPDGRLPGRWRWVLRGYLAVCAALVAISSWQDISGIGARRIRIDSTGELASAGGAPGAVGLLFALLFVAFCLVSVIRQVVSYRRSTGVLRQQLKWLLSGGALCLTGLILTLSGATFAFVAIIALPIGMGVGILKYRLYEIDRIISKTLVYGVLTVILGASYIGLVLAGQAISSAFTGNSNLAVAASTLIVAALFLPVRSRVQRFVDRRFYRRRYDAQRTLEGFGARLREQVDLGALEQDLRGVVTETMQPAHASVWLREASR